MNRFCLSALLALSAAAVGVPGAGSAAPAAAVGVRAQPPVLDPRPIETFDGASWSGLTFGRTTRDDLKGLARTRKGGDFPNGVDLEQPEDAECRVELLFSGGGRDARLEAVSFRFTGDGYPLEAVERALKTAGEDRYEPGRPEERRLVLFRDRGVLLQVLDEQVRHILLAPPERLARWADRATAAAPTPIKAPAGAKGEVLPLLVEFGRVRYEYEMANGSSPVDQEAVRQALDEEVRAISGGGMLRYRDDAPGEVILRLTDAGPSGSEKNRDTAPSFKAVCRVRGVGPYGPVDAVFTGEEDYSSGALKGLVGRLLGGVGGAKSSGDADGGNEPNKAAVRAASAALRQTDSKFAAVVEADSPENRRIAAWVRIINGLRAASD
jgi:hypothetical protein